MEEIKLKNGEFYIICLKNLGNSKFQEYNIENCYKMKVKGKLFTYKDIDFGISGNSKEGYRLNHIKSGMLVNGRIYKKLNDFKEDIENIYQFLIKFNENQLLKIEKLLNECEEKGE